MKDECPDCGCEAHALREQLNNANEAFAQAIHQRDALRAEIQRLNRWVSTLRAKLAEA